MFFHNVCKDFNAALGGSNGQIKQPFSFKRKFTVLLSFEFHVVLFYRFYSFLYDKSSMKYLGFILYQLSKFLFKCDINPGARIEAGLHLVHGFNVIVGADAIIGENVCLFDGVSIGKKNVGTNDGMPIIKNNVIIGTGAKVLGNIIIEEGVIIGANSVVIKSIVEKNVSVAGVPARIIRYGANQ
ncbi:hypothetical protein V7T16_18050 [Vibrio metoecus]|uniref:serine O-acetyltransferase n=1 Tax=Vibrio metoecus TaxID=1481663 RepID=UPI0006D828FC|nr:hypothetical protein [Vibrio metoecus]